MRLWQIRMMLRCALFFLAVASWAASAQMVAVAGVIVDQNNAPVARVSVQGIGIGATLSTTSGQFRLGRRPVGSSVTLQVQKPGWTVRDPAALRIIVPSDPVANPVRIVMVRRAAIATVAPSRGRAGATAVPPRAQTDPISALVVISMVPQERRTEACRRLLTMRQCSDFALVISNVAFTPPTSAQQTIIDEVVRTGEVKPAQAQELAACRGDFRFVIADNLLKCANGDSVPVVLTTNSSGALSQPFALIIHSTEIQASAVATAQLMSGAKDEIRASVHLIVGKSGGIVQLLPFDRTAWHVGNASWRGMRGLNRRTIGISFVNVEPEPYTAQQIAIAKALAVRLVERYALSEILGHADLAPDRRSDPGDEFPMDEVRAAGGLRSSEAVRPPMRDIRERANPAACRPATPSPGVPLWISTRLRQRAAEIFDLDCANLTEQTAILADYPENLDAVEFAMVVDMVLGFEMPEGDVKRLRTIGDVERYIAAHIKKSAPTSEH